MPDFSLPRGVLLIRSSPIQTYCANFLAREGLIDGVVVEAGNSFAPASLGFDALVLAGKRILKQIRQHPRSVGGQVAKTWFRSKWWGNQDFYNARLLGPASERLAEGLDVHRVDHINDPSTRSWIMGRRPEVVFVFGTGLLRPELFSGMAMPFVNMHWGWSPDYRGEGIVSALALGGVGHLGVTVHVIDASIDGGAILYRARPTVDHLDNFYSIGVKLAMIGTELFREVYRDVERQGAISGIPQSPGEGRVYTSKYMRTHPELFFRAWRNLATHKRALRSEHS